MATITDSWAEINRKCSDGLANEYYAIGDLKPITLTWSDGKTETINLELLGIEHDDLADGSGKAILTFVSMELLAESRKMNGSTAANAGGWAGSNSLRNWCNTDLYNALPSDLRSIIRPVTKLSDGGYNSTTLVETQDKVWFLSKTECSPLGFGQLVTLEDQGTRYAGTSARDFRPKYKANGTQYAWWLRSSHIKTQQWGLINTYAQPAFDNTSLTMGVAFGLCVGRQRKSYDDDTMFSIKASRMQQIADEVRRISGKKETLTPQQIYETLFDM